jgi:DUF4097 and DUF4098 domain-containing protein YvlB
MRSWAKPLLAGVIVMAGAAAPTGAEQKLLDSPRDWVQRFTDDGDYGPRETETVERTVPFPAGGTLRVKNFSGDIRITPASGGNLVLKATRRAPRETLDHVKLEVMSSGSTVTIDANDKDPSWNRPGNRSDVVDTQMEIQVPATANLDIDAFSSAVTVEGIGADQRLKTFSGPIVVRGLKGEIDAETFSADIRVVLDSVTKGSVSFDSFSGRLDSDVAITTTSYDSRGRGRRARRIDGNLPGGSGPRLRFHTFSGDVELRTN